MAKQPTKPKQVVVVSGTSGIWYLGTCSNPPHQKNSNSSPSNQQGRTNWEKKQPGNCWKPEGMFQEQEVESKSKAQAYLHSS
jgi:hypothetical protein